MPPRVPRGHRPAAHKREPRAWARPNLGGDNRRADASTQPKAHPQPRCARPAITHTRRCAAVETAACAAPCGSPSAPSHPAPAAPWLPLLTKLCATACAGLCGAHKDTAPRAPPRRPTPCTRRTSVPLAMHPTHPLRLLASALWPCTCDILHSSRRAVWYTHAQGPTAASAVPVGAKGRTRPRMFGHARTPMHTAAPAPSPRGGQPLATISC